MTEAIDFYRPEDSPTTTAATMRKNDVVGQTALGGIRYAASIKAARCSALSPTSGRAEWTNLIAASGVSASPRASNTSEAIKLVRPCP